MTAFRYLDLTLVVALSPFVVLAGLPVVGYVFVAAGWAASRLLAEYLDHRAAGGEQEMGARFKMQIAGMMARVWIVTGAVLAARFVGDREDGVMAAAVALALFTVYLGASAVIRPYARNVIRP